MELLRKFEVLDEKIFNCKSEMPIGLASGIMGLCIYFYRISRLCIRKDYEQMGNNLLDEIFSKISEVKTYDLKDGLVGIGLGINYLIENKFVLGDSNKILRDLDAELFKQICYSDRFKEQDILLKLELIIYFIVRLKNKNIEKENTYLFKEIIIYAINLLSEDLDIALFEENYSFDLNYLPAYYLLSLSLCVDFYKDKIYKILKELSPFFLSKVPISQANRLYYFYAINNINEKIDIEGWKEYANLLAREVNIAHIIDNELSRKMFLWDGLPAIYILLSGLSKYFNSYKYQVSIINKIESSANWDTLFNNEQRIKEKSGFFSGYTGTSLIILNYYKYESRFK